MATIFTRIIEGEIPGVFVWRDEQCVAFMSINPMAFGHTLVVPIEEVDHWAVAQQAAFSPARVGVIIAGYEVPHAHIHVVPTDDISQLSFVNAATSVPPDEIERAAAMIRAALDELEGSG
jgi:histidine triad (HIT) family protein